MGKVFRFNKDVDTDQIIASQYLLYPTVDEMKAHTFESLDINIGLPAIVCDGLYDAVRTGDEIELDMEKGIVTFGDQTFSCTRLPVHLQKILDQGGLISSLDEM